MESLKITTSPDTIAAIATPSGTGGIAVVRISGPEAISIVNSAWKGTNLIDTKPRFAHYGKYFSIDGNLLDDAVATTFVSPASFTGEDMVEIGIHGSSWIQSQILIDLIKRGARMASPGEFTQRAFLNGKIDLAQAEGIADLISSASKASHDIAINQTKGLFSEEFNRLRNKLIEFASLLELELDFSEEDVEFADRSALSSLCTELIEKISRLVDSYTQGSVIKDGVPVVIAGIPNAGKSSLLNLLLKDSKAIVTDIPGTTRDLIEDKIEINGILFRFIDTAGIRSTEDVVEAIGVDRAFEALKKASIVIWVIDATQSIASQQKELDKFIEENPSKKIIILRNKSDIHSSGNQTENYCNNKIISLPFSVKTHQGFPDLIDNLTKMATEGYNTQTDIILTNARHYESLSKALESLRRAQTSLSPTIENANSAIEGSLPYEEQDNRNSEIPINTHLAIQDNIDSEDPINTESLIQVNTDSFVPLSADFIAQDVREAITQLSSLTGSITSQTLLNSIFSRFCIGK